MAVKSQVDKIKDQVKQLRKAYADTVASANKAVSKGLEKLADQELKAVRKHYEEAIKDLKKAGKKGNVRDVAKAQAKVLQNSLDQVVKSARDSVNIISSTSNELADILKKASKEATATTGKKPAAKKPAAKKPAVKRPAAKKPAAKKATASKGAAKKPAAKKATARKSAATGAKPATRKRATARKKAS